MRYLIFLLLLSSAIFGTWGVETATSEVCFYYNVSVATTGLDDDNWYDVAVLPIELNGTFWNSSTLIAYHNATGTEQPVFQFASNSSHAFIFVPVVESLSADELDYYCVYAGGPDNQSLYHMAPYGIGFSNYTELTTYLSKSTYGGTYWNVTQDGVYTNVSTDGRMGYRRSGLSNDYEATEIFVKMKPTDVSESDDRIGAYSGYNSFYSESYGYGVGIYTNDYKHGWYIDSTPDTLDTGTLDEWRILRGGIDSVGYGSVYHDNYTLIDTDTTTLNSYRGNIARDYPLYINTGEAQFEWGIMFDYLGGYNNWTVFNTTYDYVSENITFLSPDWGESFGPDDAAIMRVQFLQSFDNCSVSLNDDPLYNYTSIGADQIEIEVMDGDDMVIGTNTLSASCYDSGTEYHKYWYFVKTSSSSDDLFNTAFGFTPTEQGCSAAVIEKLSVCTEAYNISHIYDFGAVVCPYLNLSLDYSCLGMSNSTKNNYTVFHPTTYSWPAASESQPHIGAVFYVNQHKLQGMMEVYSPTGFVYLPAQDKPRDCGIYYSTTDYCSWGDGFTLNNASVIISNIDNEWYISGGSGIEEYNTNWSQVVIDTQVIPIINVSQGTMFPDGIFTRSSCYVRDDHYLVNMKNTKSQLYTMTVTGNYSYTISVSSTLFTQNISLDSVTSVTVATDDGNSTLCSWGSGQLMFLPFDLEDVLVIDGYQILVWVVLIFSVILSAVSPFGLFIVFIFNDAYQLVDITEIALVAVFAAIAGFANNATSLDRGVKHMLVIAFITMAYIMTISSQVTGVGVYNDELDDVTTGLETLMKPSNVGEFLYSGAKLIVDIMVLVLKLPFIFVDLVYSLVGAISAPLYTALTGVVWYIQMAFAAFVYLKAYEVITNRFRGV